MKAARFAAAGLTVVGVLGALVGCGSDSSSSPGGGSGGSAGVPATGGTTSAGTGGTGGSIAGGTGGTATSGGILVGSCGDPVPAGAQQAPDPPAYTGGTCPTITTGRDTPTTITSSGVARQFVTVLPSDVQAGEMLPVVFLWHWLGGSAGQFYDIIGAQDAVNQARFIAVIPEAIGGTAASPNSNPISKWRGWAAPNPQSMEDEEFVFFDDMLSCVSQQLPVDKNCVSSAGVSDGALWTSQLIGGRGKYLASAVVLSGGVAELGDENASLIKPYIPSTEHPMPVLVLWGGPNDICVILKFQTATKALESHLQAEGHFILECQHNCGHSVPPIDITPGQSLITPFVDFISQHPYWTSVGHSPYETSGLPAGLPAWCAIGAGAAVARTGACPSALGCPVATPPAM